jgi:Leucine-rich repeat (LRR) protein
MVRVHSISGSFNFQNRSGFSLEHLKHLSVLKLGWFDHIEKLHDFKNLTYLEIRHGSIKHFKGLDKLIEAVFMNVRRLDLSGLQSSSKLKTITLSHCSIADGMEILRGIEDISLIATTVPDYSVLSNCRKAFLHRITGIDFSRNELHCWFQQVKELDIGGSLQIINNVDVFHQLPKLKSLTVRLLFLNSTDLVSQVICVASLPELNFFQFIDCVNYSSSIQILDCKVKLIVIEKRTGPLKSVSVARSQVKRLSVISTTEQSRPLTVKIEGQQLPFFSTTGFKQVEIVMSTK